MYDFLLFAHVLAGFSLLAMVVMYSGFAFGGPAPKGAVNVAYALDAIGGVGTLIFGVWLALYVDGYGILDGWIIAALILWAAAAETGRRSHARVTPTTADGTVAAVDRDMIRWHVIRTALIVILLADMIFKPGA